MRAYRVLAIVSILVLGAASGARGQYEFGYPHRSVEITPFGGSRFGGVIDLNPTLANPFNYLTIKSTWDYGVMGDVDLIPSVQAEFMWNRQPTELGAHNVNTGITTPAGDATLDMYQWGFLVAPRGPEAKLSPFFVGSFGFTHYSASGVRLGFSDGFSYTFGGGLKYFFSRHAGLRLDVRYSPSHTTSSPGLVCDPFGFCFAATIPNYAHQGQANLGLILRF
jgi:hypothetical protein